MKTTIVTAWVTENERDAFLDQWDVRSVPPWLLLQRDEHREGCGATKNRGILRAVDAGAEVVVVLDGDCYPCDDAPTLEALIEKHKTALAPQAVTLFERVTEPASRGTPYACESVMMPAAASMGFWIDVPDYCAVRQLSFNAKPMTFSRTTIHGRYFPLCGMNVAFKPIDWWPWCQFIEVSRFDDIWMGWLWQKEAYRRGHCFNLNGPMIRHARQSNVWKNLKDEALHLEATETLWRDIALHDAFDYDTLLSLVPTGTERLSREPLSRAVGR